MSSEARLKAKLRSMRKALDMFVEDVKGVSDTGTLACSDANSLRLFRGMVTTLPTTLDGFNNVWANIEELSLEQTAEFPTDEDLEVRRAFMGYYHKAMAFREELVSQQNNQTINESVMSSTRARLPRVALPKFSGELKDWQLFKSTFVALIHEDPSIPSIEKYNLLLTSLVGEALNFIRSIPSLNADYARAWNHLTTRYDNPRKLASMYLQEMFAIKPISSPSSAASLQNYYLKVRESVNTFDQIEVPDKADFFFFFIAIRGLDPDTRSAFELEYQNTPFPKYEDLMKFIERRQNALSMNAEAPSNSKSTNLSRRAFYTQVQSGAGSESRSANSNRNESSTSATHSCHVCCANHSLIKCPKFQNATPRDRVFKLLKKFKGCRNCLYLGHPTSHCKSKYSCQQCNLRHHTLLHIPKQQPNPKEVEKSNDTGTCGNPHEEVGTSLSSVATTPDVLLGTALAYIVDAKGCSKTVRLVVDSGSQYSFITQSCVNRLGLRFRKHLVKVSGIGSATLASKGMVECTIRSCQDTSTELSTQAVVVPSITSLLPQTPLSPNIFKHFRNFKLADPEFFKPAQVDFLLGADLYPEVVCGAPWRPIPELPYVLDTLFGAVLIGRISSGSTSTSAAALHCITSLLASDHRLEKAVQRFWEQEEISANPVPHPDHQECEEHFKNTHFRLPNGRYGVALPFKRPCLLGPSRERARLRMLSLERKFKSDPDFHRQYNEGIQDYLNQGHLVPTTLPGSYYVPHHAVRQIRNGKEKVRIVFDFSAKTSKGSLNDYLHVGPKLHNELNIVILRFRLHSIAFTCDIVGMFRQIVMSQSDRQFLHVLWRDEQTGKIAEYQLCVLGFGLSCSSFCAIRVLHQLIADEGSKFPIAAQCLLQNTFVDDIASGGETVDEVHGIIQQLTQLLALGQFQLSKWASNSKEVLEGMSHQESTVEIASNSEESRILGMKWDTHSDTLSWMVQEVQDDVPTKRTMLSAIARLYDPLGYVAPVVFLAKSMMQEAWRINLQWDDPIPPPLSLQWHQFIKGLPELRDCRIPRCLQAIKNGPVRVVGFSDASLKGCCACIYLVALSSYPYEPFLLTAKTKVAPLKTQTIPRLELMGATLLAKLYASLSQYINELTIQDIYFFTDSSIVLNWLSQPPYNLETFVANRVQQISSLTSLECWKHTRSEANPADIGSRGVLPTEIKHNHLWWRGPSWLKDNREDWPKSSLDVANLVSFPDLIAPTTLFVKEDFSFFVEFTGRFSMFHAFHRCIRVLATMRRFIENLRINKKGGHLPRVVGPITASEFESALHCCIGGLQKHFYPYHLFKSSKLFNSLQVFLDPQGLYRVGGRLKNSLLDSGAKHPLLLPRRSHFCDILVDHFHLEKMHSGVSAIQAAVQRRFWIPALKSLVKKRKSKCIRCIRFMKTSTQPVMGDLPPNRVTPDRPFNRTGVDFAGPFLVRPFKRSKSLNKAYLCIFVCMVTKAIHLELVSNLTTEEFLATFERFTARRGRPTFMFSDCGTTFKGAARILRELYDWWNDRDTQGELVSHACSKGIEWQFNPPKGPNFGGLWESGVKVTKHLLYKALGNQPFLERELHHIFTKIEAILNSRPLYPISDDPDDLEPLTPAHFLIGGTLDSIPEKNLQELPKNRLSRWQFVKDRVQYFWRRWHTEYLYTLQARSKWIKPQVNLEVGDLVLLAEPDSAPLLWPLARITHTFPGKDQVVRVVRIKTKSGEFTRPVSKLVSLSALSRASDSY